MIDLKLTITGEREVARRVEAQEERLRNLRPAFERIARDFYAHEEEVFRTGGRANRGGGRWSPLSRRYAAEKARRYPGRGINVRSGKLKASLTQPGAEGNVEEVAPNSLTLGTSVEYARYPQYGTNRMPRRALIDLPRSVERRWVHYIEDHVKGEG